MIQVDAIRRIENQAILKYSRKFTLPLPDPFIEANNLQPKDEMEIYRERVNGRDALIIIPKNSIAETENMNEALSLSQK